MTVYNREEEKKKIKEMLNKQLSKSEDMLLDELGKALQKKRAKSIIENFIIFWTSDEKEREDMYEVLEDYLKEEEVLE